MLLLPCFTLITVIGTKSAELRGVEIFSKKYVLPSKLVYAEGRFSLVEGAIKNAK
jgi:hypothetical protein